ncbi:MAG: CDP-glycerol glycerophosphotransferase family protein [Lachnospiraceae bacterium]|nr:CDP-glycerol glycerophosphotransferase family protein [Lachnospiraceae bacterium]
MSKLHTSDLSGRLQIGARDSVYYLLKLLQTLPMKKNSIVFEEYQGRSASCNPRAIYEYLRTNYPGRFSYVWAFKDPEAFREEFAGTDVTLVRYGSFEWIRACVQAGTVIYNIGEASYIPRRKGQLTINTWHAGGAFKRVGLSSEKESALHHWQHDIVPSRQTAVYLSSSDTFTKYNIREAYHFTGTVWNSGMPRNDLFFDRDKMQAAAMKARETLGLDEESLLVLYAPTYRGGIEKGDGGAKVTFPARELVKAVEERFERPCRLLFRTHYLDKNTYAEEEGITDVSSYPNMQELLAAADILITDYSSSMWDFALTGKPCLLFVPDLEYYAGEDRGFYTPPETWPGMLCHNDAELAESIRSLDLGNCVRIAETSLAAFGSCEHGDASKKVCEAIVRHIEKLEEKRGEKA